MTYFDLVDNMYYSTDPSPLVIWDPEKKRIVPLNETTTADAVSFLPSHLGVVKAKVADLAKLKKDWKIEILEQENLREVSFEDSYRILVPNEHWDSFCSIFDSAPTNNEYLNIGSLLNETMEEEMKNLRQELRVGIAHLFDEAEFDKMSDSVNSWKWRFGVTSYVSRRKLSVAITYENKAKEIQRLYDRLIKVYGEDRGNLEMLIEAVRDKTPLNTFKVLKGYDHIYGTRILSRYLGVKMYFETLLDFTYQLHETIYIPKADDLLDKIAEESKEVKVVRSVVYPKGGVFTSRFLRVLSDMIENLGTEEEE